MAATHIPRCAEIWLGEMLPYLPAIMIDGAKGVGKTQTAEQFANTVFELDQTAVREVLSADYDRLREDNPPILLDEWQWLPEVWDRVRRMVDRNAPAGSIILTGSVQSKNPNLHSGAGRIVRMRMRPLSLAERIRPKEMVALSDCLNDSVPARLRIKSPLKFSDYMYEIIRSGFPSIYSAPEQIRKSLIDSYLDNIVEREFLAQGLRVHQPQALRRWLTSYAAATGTTTSYTKILDAASAGEDNKPAKPTTTAYREALHRLWLIDDLAIWGEGEDFFGRLKKTPKHFLADPALEARLLGLNAHDLINGTARNQYDPEYGSIAGRLFESLCAMSLRTYAINCGASVSHLRNARGSREVDFIIQRDQDIVAIEAKMSASVTDEDVENLNWFAEEVGTRVKEKIVLTTGEWAYRRIDGVLVIPAALFGA